MPSSAPSRQLSRQQQLLLLLVGSSSGSFVALEPLDYRSHFVEGWPGPHDDGSGVGVVNQSSYEWSISNLPLFESSDDDLNQAYYYRAKSYKSHMIPTDWVDIKHVSSEFGPSVPWGGVYGSINAAAGHHITEGRWIRDRDYTSGLVRFWVGSQNELGEPKRRTDGVFEPGFGHFRNGSRGATGPCAYSSWILSASVKAAAVQGDLSLGLDIKGNQVEYKDLLDDMVEWWETRSLQLRTDCIIMNGDKQMNPAEANRSCLDLAPTHDIDLPYCYTMADGWDAMEGSVSGDGCRPTIGAMMFSEALAIAAIANSTAANTSLAAKFEQRAAWIREWYLDKLWSDEVEFLAVYKQGAEFTSMGGCTRNTAKNLTDSGCCCIKPGTRPLRGHYQNFTHCPPEWVYSAPPSPGNVTRCKTIGPGSQAQTCTIPGSKCGDDYHASLWPCDKPVAVRELLGLGPAYYFGITPKQANGTKYDGMWRSLFDEKTGFWGEYGPTTVARRETCFNHSQDIEECNWAGPSWPYETSRVLTGLSNFLVEYPHSQSHAAGMNNSHYTRLLKTYAFSMTHGDATNGSVPWVGENIEPDKGYWIAHSIQYRGGPGTIDLDNPWLPAAENPRVMPVNCSVCLGTCWDRDWATHPGQAGGGPGIKCTPMANNISYAKRIGPCDPGCDCVPPPKSYNYLTHSSVPCCHIAKDVKLPDGTPANCDGKKLPTADKDRGKDYNHSTFLDLIIEGLVGIRAAFSDLLVVHPLADETIKYFALDNLAYHGHNISVFWDPQGARWPNVGCKGLCLFLDGKMAAKSSTLTRLELKLK